MVDVNGAEVVTDAVVTLTGTVTSVSEDSVTLKVDAPVFHEYPKAIAPGVTANSKEHEAALREELNLPPGEDTRTEPRKKGKK